MLSVTGPIDRFVSVLSVLWLSIILSASTPLFAQSEHSKAIDPIIRERWVSFLQRKPFPYHKPLPAEIHTPVDGIYVKFDPRPHPHVPCRRCPDWVPEGGIWKLQFDRGVMRIFFAKTGWKSISSFEVAGGRLLLFNDPHCTNTTGAYDWRLHDGQLVLDLIHDSCAENRRGNNLTKQPWLSCQPPNEEAAITGHWPVPTGCE